MNTSILSAGIRFAVVTTISVGKRAPMLNYQGFTLR